MSEKLNLDTAEIREVKPSGLMDRCCIDLIGNFKKGEGMLVGLLCKGFFLVHSETLKSPFTNARPFRVNAGPVSAYTLIPEKRTKYLCELRAGDKVLVVDHQGNTREAEVGRNKIETSPSLLIRAHHPKLKKIPDALGVKKGEFHTFLQHAETITLINERGEPVRADLLKKGDKVLVWLENPEPVGRHFGAPISIYAPSPRMRLVRGRKIIKGRKTIEQ